MCEVDNVRSREYPEPVVQFVVKATHANWRARWTVKNPSSRF